MTTIHVTFYGVLKQETGTKRQTVEISGETPTVRALAESLAAQYPALAARLSAVAFAVQDTLVPPEHVLADGDRVALLPPVSGG